MTERNPCMCCILRYINGEQQEIRMPAVVVAIDPYNCEKCREEKPVGEACPLEMCTPCYEYNNSTPQKCPHGVLMRISEPVEIR